MEGSRALALGPWAEALEVVPAPEVAAELLARRAEGGSVRSVWVTDLVDLRPAYWRSTAPVTPSPERRALMEAGRETHVRVGHVLAAARYREVRLQREGITGQIDLFEDRPTELKTTRLTGLDEPDRAVRSSYLDQLAMYCALADRDAGRLVLVDPAAEPPAVAVYDLRVRDLGAVWDAMRERAGALRTALERRSPAGLPGCPWRGRGCEFEAAEVCDCRGSEPPPATPLVTLLDPPKADPGAASSLAARLATPTGPLPPARRFRDLVYLRRAYFERVEPVDEPAGAPAARPAPGDDLYRTLSDLLESGPTGEMTREPTEDGEPLESVACFRGDPLLLRVSKAWSATPRDDLLKGQPQYFLELALRCAALGRTAGWLVLGYARAASWEEKVYLYRVRFGRPETLAPLLDERLRALRDAVERRSPYDLPACPGWMYESCPYRSRCECAGLASDGRSNR